MNSRPISTLPYSFSCKPWLNVEFHIILGNPVSQIPSEYADGI
ncbi:hypothetical protein JCM37173_02390 [Allocoprococcus similis]